MYYLGGGTIMNQQVAKVTKVNIWQQDLTSRPIKLNYMGHVKNVDEARVMLETFNHCDEQAVRDGKHTYFFTCETAQQ